MNLYFRLFRIIVRAWFAKRIGLFDEGSVRFRVWPTDCDINLHLTNGRYLNLMDLGRTYLMAELDILGKIVRRRWLPVLGGVRIDFFRPLNPFQSFELKTRLLAWDDKWFYLEQTFVRNGQTCAQAQLRALFLGSEGKISTPEILKLGGYGDAVSPLVSTEWTSSKD
jgi:acyl-CoA thioesterase FadM